MLAPGDDARGRRSLSAIFAHPDDETYATGATIARHAAEGVRCSLYCATDGDAGKTSGIPVSSPAELGRLRRVELQAASAILGIGTVVHGGHADGHLSQADPDAVIAQIVHLLRVERPDVVVTFGPEGAPTRHRDHRAISRLATSAFLLAGTNAFDEQFRDGVLPFRPARLCVVTWPAPGIDDLYQALGQPPHVRVDARPWNATKHAAFLAHTSQRQHQPNFERHALTDEEWYSVVIGSAAPTGATSLFD
ncbi:PIG-L family deacetylase [soil metagenome]